MRGTVKHVLFGFGLAALVVLPVANVEAQLGQRTQRTGMTVWADADFRGASHSILDDTPDLGPTGMARRISSFRITSGETWEVCTEPNYGGRCRAFTTTVTNMNDIGWNDIVMSVRRVRRGGGGFPGVPPERDLPPARGLELYAGINYSGQRLILTEETPDFRRREFNDRAISLRVPQNETWEICINAEYDQCRTISDDVPDLAAIGFSRNISAARLVRTGRGRGRGWGGWWGGGNQQQQQPRLVLYDGINFSGQSFTLETDEPNLRGFATAGSVQIQGGRWQLCDQPRYLGRCVTISQSERDLGRVALLRRVASVRRQ